MRLFSRKKSETPTELTDEERNCALLVNLKSGGRAGETVGELFANCGVTVIPLLETTQSSPTRDDRLQELGAVIQNGGHIIIAGGDGTAAWGIQVIGECCQVHELDFPFVTTYPIGTGNDLSRCLGWGNKQPALKLSAVETLLHKYCKRQREGSVSVLDRWGLDWQFTDPTNTNTCWGRPLPQNFLCYVSIGYDSRIAYEFEVDRQNAEASFNSAAKNQAVYVYHGAKEFFSPMRPLTRDDVRVWVDGEEVELQPGTRSLKIMNINSAVNGLFYWGSASSSKRELQTWHAPRLDDGEMEVISSTGLKSMLGFRLNYGHAHRIAQTRHIVWEIMREMEIQVDGEAWVQKPCRLEFFLRDQIPVLVGKFGCRGVHEDVAQIHKKPAESKEIAEKRRQWIADLDTLARNAFSATKNAFSSGSKKNLPTVEESSNVNISDAPPAVAI